MVILLHYFCFSNFEKKAKRTVVVIRSNTVFQIYLCLNEQTETPRL